MKKTLLTLTLAFASVGLVSRLARSQPLKEVPKDALKPGDAAPPLRFEAVLQGPTPSETTLDALRGNVVVLDFWGTWCAPCVGDIPHLNDLIAHFEGRPVRFIAVGHENEKKVGWFLKEHPIHAWVGLDTKLSIYRSYSAWGIPHAVIIDGQGIVAAVLNPSDMTPTILDDVLAGKRPTYPPLPPAAYWDPDNAAKWFREVGERPPPSK